MRLLMLIGERAVPVATGINNKDTIDCVPREEEISYCARTYSTTIHQCEKSIFFFFLLRRSINKAAHHISVHKVMTQSNGIEAKKKKKKKTADERRAALVFSCKNNQPFMQISTHQRKGRKGNFRRAVIHLPK